MGVGRVAYIFLGDCPALPVTFLITHTVGCEQRVCQAGTAFFAQVGLLAKQCLVKKKKKNPQQTPRRSVSVRKYTQTVILHLDCHSASAETISRPSRSTGDGEAGIQARWFQRVSCRDMATGLALRGLFLGVMRRGSGVKVLGWVM